MERLTGLNYIKPVEKLRWIDNIRIAVFTDNTFQCLYVDHLERTVYDCPIEFLPRPAIFEMGIMTISEYMKLR